MKQKFIMIPVFIQGPKQPDNDIDVYLRQLVEELLQLWNIKVYVCGMSTNRRNLTCMHCCLSPLMIGLLSVTFQDRQTRDTTHAPGATFHCRPIPQGYAVVMVDEIMEGFEELQLTTLQVMGRLG